MMTDLDYNRPVKKRRFFVEDDHSDSVPTPPSVERKDSGEHGQPRTEVSTNAPPTESDDQASGFDTGTLEAFIGESLQPAIVQKLHSLSGGNVERAINIYLDGSYKKSNSPAVPTSIQAFATPVNRQDSSDSPRQAGNGTTDQAQAATQARLATMPTTRYVGAFGVVGWATRSGSGLIKSGDNVSIERTKTQSFAKTGANGKPKLSTRNRREDTVVRFTNSRGEEVGRFETDSSAWIAPLLDQKICSLEGHCIYAPDRIRSNDTIYLQIRASLRKSIFEDRSFLKPQESNRTAGVFEEKETQEERDLHLRQLALVKLFNEINLDPTKANATTEKHKRQGLLKSVEDAEKKEASTTTQDGEEDEDGKELEQDQLDTLYSKAQTFDFNTPERQPADTFNMDLRKYQKQALHWMIGKETDAKQDHKEMSMHPLWEEYAWPEKDVDNKDLPTVEDQANFYVNPYSGELSLDFPVQEQNCLGGILADEMGLGKTIEMLSLMHSNRSEIDAKSHSGEAADVNRLPRLPRRLSGGQVEPAPCTTLVVAPMSLIAQWQSEAEKASKAGTLKSLMYYGTDRNVSLKNLCCAANAASAPNLIITSYGTILSEHTAIASSGSQRGASGGLFSLDYNRVILDEAHHIKNRQSKTAKACYEISAQHRWVLTGTPIVNRLEDLFSLVHFLRVEPWSNFSFWKTFITTPFDAGDYMKALDVVQTVLEPLVLRRTKDMKTPDGEALVPLPPRTITVEPVKLSQDERDVYDLIFNRAKRTFASNVEAGTLMKSYTTIFAQILRLRQSCDHPLLVRNAGIVADEEDASAAADAAAGLADDMDLQSLIARFSADPAEADTDANRFGAHALQQIQDGAGAECPICAEEPMEAQAVAAGCWHSACKACLTDYLARQAAAGELPRCFNCRAPVTSRDVFEVFRDDDDDGDDTSRVTLRRLGSSPSSAKILALLAHLQRQRRVTPDAKSVVFSQFTSFLDLLGPALAAARIPVLRLDGSLSQKARADVLARFAGESGPRAAEAGTVLLVSLRAGGVGLNLTSARAVFVMDPWWSWAVESQAIDRVHRMGQVHEVSVVRFVCEDSIEEKMLRIQERKKFIASSLGMMTEDEKRTQRIEDIRELLS